MAAVFTRLYNSRQFGRRLESRACRYLQQQGLVLVCHNYLCKLGEIDLVMRDSDQFLVFVEVRYRRAGAYGDAVASVTPAKQHHCRQAASHFLATHPHLRGLACRFDVVGLSPDAVTGELRFNWIRHAFM